MHVPEMRRSPERFKRAVDFQALVRRDSLGCVRELDIRSRLCFADDQGQVGGNCFYCGAVILVVGQQGSL